MRSQAETEAERPRDQQWEYATVVLQGDTIAACNHAGKVGWEVIQIQELEDGQLTAFVKRRPSAIITTLSL